MAKLPPTFVKAPPAATLAASSATPSTEQPAKPRRARKSSLVAEAPRDARDVLLRLDEAVYQALEDARAELQRAGEDVSLEQMVQRVLTEWIRARTAPARIAPAAAPIPPAPERRDDGLVDRLRAFAAAPLRTWRELGATLRRMSGLPAR
ncbi:MAG TPA: hypothetical protein VM734_03960 [Kofleriaceae bacterium]|nr:hypothetical protein [Kofleriaceae bacterium]